MIKQRCAPVLAAVVCCAASVHLLADDAYVGINGIWSDPTVWSTSLVPAAGENVLVTPAVGSGASNTLTLDVSASVGNLTLGATGNGTAILNLGGHTLTAAATS